MARQGVVALWGEAPVWEGVYLVAWWRVSYPMTSWPRVTAFRVGGRWVAAPYEVRSRLNGGC